jgi:hypothetical protein
VSRSDKLPGRSRPLHLDTTTKQVEELTDRARRHANVLALADKVIE